MNVGTQSIAVTVDQEIGRREELTGQFYTGMQFLEDMGAGVFGKCNGENVLAILLLYRVGGSVWGVDEAVINQTSFHAAPYDRRKIEDNDFLSHRVDPIYRSDDFTITRESDRVIWQAGPRQVVARPPFWDIKGEHAGVDVDITMQQSGDADWLVGPWEKLGDEGRAGRDLFATASGRISALGKTYHLEPNSIAINEHVVFGERWVAEAQAYSPQYFYHLFRNDEIQIFVYVRPDSGVIYGRVVFTDGREIRYDWDDVTVTEGEYWLDPRDAHAAAGDLPSQPGFTAGQRRGLPHRIQSLALHLLDGLRGAISLQLLRP